MKLFPRTLAAATLLSFAASALTCVSAAEMPYLDTTLSPEKRARDLIRRLTIEEKIGQMAFVYMIFLEKDEHVAEYSLGALFGSEIPSPQTPLAWAILANRYQSTPIGFSSTCASIRA